MGRGGNGGGGGGGTTVPAPTTGSRTFAFSTSGVTVNARMGNSSLALADGGAVSTWYFTPGFNGDRQWSGPVIEGVEGETINITLSSMRPHTIHLHGLDVDQENDGVPATSGFVGSNTNGNFGRVDGKVNLGDTYTYTFVAPHAGTYQYHCHVDTPLHYDMGMFGTIIIRPKSGSITEAWDGGPTFAKEHVWQLATFDTSWHAFMITGTGTARYRPDRFMINGRNGNDLNTDTTVAVSANAGEQVLIRVNQTSYQSAMIDLGGLEFDVIASDGRPMATQLTDTSIYIAPGERYDLLVTMPASGTVKTATVNYYDNRGDAVIGTATTTITSL